MAETRSTYPMKEDHSCKFEAVVAVFVAAVLAAEAAKLRTPLSPTTMTGLDLILTLNIGSCWPAVILSRVSVK